MLVPEIKNGVEPESVRVPVCAPAANVSVTIVPSAVDPSPFIPNGRTGADGSFDVRGVLPGSYVLHAQANSGATGEVAVQIGDGDLSNLVVAIAPGAQVNGRFVIDGQWPAGANPDVSLLRVGLRRDPDLLGVPFNGPSFTPPPVADGSFEFGGVPSGDYQVSVRALPDGAYLKSARFGSTDVLESGLHLSGTPRDTLEVVIGTQGGSLSGTVLGANREPLVNATVALVPDVSARRRIDLFKTTTTDTQGRFRLRAIPPGSYTVLAWEQIEDGAWWDPEVLRAAESQGRSVRVRDGSADTTQLTAIKQ